MIVTIRIDDNLYTVYEKYAKDGRTAIEQQLKRWVDIHPKERVLVIPQEKWVEINKVLGPIENADQLLQRVKSTEKAKVDGMEVEIPQNIRERLLSQAKFQGKDPATYFKDQVNWALRSVVGA